MYEKELDELYGLTLTENLNEKQEKRYIELYNLLTWNKIEIPYGTII